MNSIYLAYLAFVAFGLSGSLLGVAWPSIRDTFALPLDAVGVLLLAMTAGHLVAGVTIGRLVSFINMGSLLAGGSLMMVLGYSGFALTPAWWGMIVGGLIVGVGSGFIDSGLNIYVAQHYPPRLMNWLHACYGIGATIGPLVMTAVFQLDLNWRYGFGAASLLQVLVLLGFGLTGKQWQMQVPAEVEEAPGLPGPGGRFWRQSVMWLSLLLFFMYGGIEVTTGQWSYPLFTEARAVSVERAGFWVSVYWGSLTTGRLLFGFVTDYIRVVTLLRLCMLGVIGGAICLWLPFTWLGFGGLILIGLAQAPIFPLLVSETPRRLGTAQANQAIGLQVGMASLGIALLPGLAGVMADSWGLETIGLFLWVSALIMLATHEQILGRIGPPTQKQS